MKTRVAFQFHALKLGLALCLCATQHCHKYHFVHIEMVQNVPIWPRKQQLILLLYLMFIYGVFHNV